MKSLPLPPCGISLIVSFALLGTAHGALDGYWPIDETSGTLAENAVPGGTDATLFNGASFFADPIRGQVLSFDGVDAHASAGQIPQLTLTTDFTWSFWMLNETAAVQEHLSSGLWVDFFPLICRLIRFRSGGQNDRRDIFHECSTI
jgi:hypothetical protein